MDCQARRSHLRRVMGAAAVAATADAQPWPRFAGQRLRRWRAFRGVRLSALAQCRRTGLVLAARSHGPSDPRHDSRGESDQADHEDDEGYHAPDMREHPREPRRVWGCADAEKHSGRDAQRDPGHLNECSLSLLDSPHRDEGTHGRDRASGARAARRRDPRRLANTDWLAGPSPLRRRRSAAHGSAVSTRLPGAPRSPQHIWNENAAAAGRLHPLAGESAALASE
jgi:hypothetical protein